MQFMIPFVVILDKEMEMQKAVSTEFPLPDGGMISQYCRILCVDAFYGRTHPEAELKMKGHRDGRGRELLSLFHWSSSCLSPS